jgi:hypothetical protein
LGEDYDKAEPSKRLRTNRSSLCCENFGLGPCSSLLVTLVIFDN